MTRDADDRRHVTVHFWYPTDSRSGEATAPYMPHFDAMRRAIPASIAAAWEKVRTHTIAGGPVSTAAARYPAVLLSHGNEMNSSAYTFLIEDLVSHGYVIVAIDHPYDARAVLTTGGKVAVYAAREWPRSAAAGPVADPTAPHARFYRARAGVRAADVLFVFRQVLADTAPRELVSRIDAHRTAAVGHSVGGVAAGMACQAEHRLKACINLDGSSATGPLYTDGGLTIPQPYLFITKPLVPSESLLEQWRMTRDEWRLRRAAHDAERFSIVTGGATRIAVGGLAHDSFTDDPLLKTVLKVEQRSAAASQAALVRQLVRSFLDEHLRGQAGAFAAAVAASTEIVSVDRWNVPVSKAPAQ